MVTLTVGLYRFNNRYNDDDEDNRDGCTDDNAHLNNVLIS